MKQRKTSFYDSLFGLIAASLGVGIMLRYVVSTGGTDLLAKILSRSYSLDIGLVILALDGFIVAVGFNTLRI